MTGATYYSGTIPCAPPCAVSQSSTGTFTPPPPRRLAHRVIHAARRIVDAAAAVLVSGVVAAGGEGVATISTSEKPGDGDEDPAQQSRRFIERLTQAEAQLDEALAQRGPGKIFTLDGRGLGTLHGKISIGKAAGALSKAFERHRATGDEILIRFADQGAGLFLTDGSGEPPSEDDATPAGEAGAGETDERAGKPSTSKNTTKSLEPQGLAPDREAAERAINHLIRCGFPVRLSTYSKAGGPILCALSPTAENINRVLDANRQGSSAGILIHAVRSDLPEGQAPKAADLEPRGLLLDLDGPQADGTPWAPTAILAALPVKPVILIETSKDRYHALIGPMDGLTLAAFKLAGKALADRFTGADPVREATKTIRLPGSLNLKHPKTPFLVRTVYEGGARR